LDKVFQLLEGFAFFVIGACLGVIFEILVAAVIFPAGYGVKPGWMLAFPLLVGISGFAFGNNRVIEVLLLLKCGVTLGTAERLSRAWIAGFIVWGVVVWAMVEGYGPFNEGPFHPRWDAYQFILFAGLLCGPPLIALLLMLSILRIRRMLT
jgi:hypothetical protein